MKEEITEQALREEGFTKSWTERGSFVFNKFKGFNIYCEPVSGHVWVSFSWELLAFPGCKTMTELRQLIKMLGGKTDA